MEIMIIAGILVAAGLAFGLYKLKGKGKKEKEPKTPPFEPLPVPPVVVEPTPEPIPVTCNAGENNTVTHFISELDTLFPTVEDLEIYLSQMVDKEADKGGYFYPPLNEISPLILNPQDDHGIYTFEYIVEKEGCKDVATLVFVAKEVAPPVEPIPTPDPVVNEFTLYLFKPFKKVTPSARSITYEVKVPNDGQDHTDLVQAQLNEFPSGTEDSPTIVKMPDYAVWTEGSNPENYGPKLKNCILLVEDKHFFKIEGGEFYTKAPLTPYGGNVSENRYSRRRHIKFLNCSDGEINQTKVTGSNLIDGRLLGTTPENTPSFWYVKDAEGNLIPAPKDSGSIGGASGYRMDWEFEHGIDLEYCQRMTFNGISIIGVWGDGVCIGHGNENIIIENSYFKYCGRQMIAVYDTSKVLIKGNVSEFNRRADVDLEPYHYEGYANEVEICNNKLHAVQVTIAAIGKGSTNDINFHHNEYSGGGLTTLNFATSFKRRNNWAITDNVRTNHFGSPAGAMKIYRTDNIYVANNIENLADSQSRSVAQFSECTNVLWENNKVNLHPLGRSELKPVMFVKQSDVEVIGGTPIEIIEF